MPSATDCPPVHNCTLKNFISNRREQATWAAGRSSSTIPVFRSTKSSTLPGAFSLTSSPITKAKKASGSSESGWLSVKRKHRKEREGKASKQPHRVPLAWRHLFSCKRHFYSRISGVKKRLIAMLLGHTFDLGIQLPSDAQKRLSKCVDLQIPSAVPSVSRLIE